MAHVHENTTPHGTEYSCPACNYGPFTRNNYFTGKLLVERDFTDEARFHMEKLRHHEQQLHGWGVVCGLKVEPHPTLACQDRFVCVEPGSAVDCCGHDIIVREKECFDFTQTPAIKALQAQSDTKPHKLQICVRFRECPTEDIPVLYDDCGCDDTKCAPNRILESYELDVMVDPKDEPKSFHTPNLKWHCTSNPPHAYRAALHTDSKRLYALTSDSNVIYQIETETYRVVGSRTLAAKGLALAVSNDGNRIYVVTEPQIGGANNLRQLIVLDSANHLTNPLVREVDIPDSEDDEVFLAAAPVPDNRLFVLLAKKGDVLIWPIALDDGNVPLPQPQHPQHPLGTNLHGLVVGSTALKAFTLDAANNKIQVLDITNMTGNAASSVLPLTFNPSALALVASTAPDMLAVVSQSLQQIALSDPDSSANAKVASLAHEPIDLVVSSGGQWAYVLEQDGDQSFIQPVNLHRLQLNAADAVTAPFKVGDKSQQVVIAATGDRLYIPFEDTVTDPKGGGIAVVEVTEQDCEDIFWRHLEGCPHCDMPDCLVLATIENYHLGDKIKAQTDPPDPKDDLTNKIARIDNRKGRRLLPNTQVLTEVVECLLEHGTGGGGTQGPPGPEGPQGNPGTPGGPGLDDVNLQIVSCEQPPSATIVPQPDGTRVLNLVVPSGCFPEDLTCLCDISWQHKGALPQGQARLDGLIIAFDKPVQRADLHSHSLRVLREQQEGDGQVLCWCELPIGIEPGHLLERCNVKSQFIASQDLMVTAVTLHLASFNLVEHRVMVIGDLIRDEKGKAIDANHLPPWFPTANYKTGDGVPGGTFHSWFTLT